MAFSLDEECLDNSSLIKEKSSKTKHSALFIFKDALRIRTCWARLRLPHQWQPSPHNPQTKLLAMFFILHPSMKTAAPTRTSMLPTHLAVLICDFLRKDYVFTRFLQSFTLYLCFQIVTFLRMTPISSEKKGVAFGICKLALDRTFRKLSFLTI